MHFRHFPTKTHGGFSIAMSVHWKIHGLVHLVQMICALCFHLFFFIDPSLHHGLEVFFAGFVGLFAPCDINHRDGLCLLEVLNLSEILKTDTS